MPRGAAPANLSRKPSDPRRTSSSRPPCAAVASSACAAPSKRTSAATARAAKLCAPKPAAAPPFGCTRGRRTAAAARQRTAPRVAAAPCTASCAPAVPATSSRWSTSWPSRRCPLEHAQLQGSGDSTWLEGHRSSLGTIWKFTHTAQPRVFAAVRSSHQTPKPAPNPQAIEDSVSVFLLLAAPRTCGAGEGRVPLWIRPDLLVREAYLGAGGDVSLCFKKHLSALVAQLQDGVGVTFAH